MTRTHPSATPAREAGADTPEEAARRVVEDFATKPTHLSNPTEIWVEHIAAAISAAERRAASRTLAERVRVEGLAGVILEAYDLTDDVLVRHHLSLAAERAGYLGAQVDERG